MGTKTSGRWQVKLKLEFVYGLFTIKKSPTSSPYKLFPTQIKTLLQGGVGEEKDGIDFSLKL